MNIRVDMQAKPKFSGVNVRYCFEFTPVRGFVLNVFKAMDTITLERRNVLLALIAAGFLIVSTSSMTRGVIF
jgi:hypothetical protein